MSHIPTAQEEYLAALETTIMDAPFDMRVEVSKFNADSIQDIPRGYVETINGWQKTLDTNNGMVTKEIVVYCI